VLHPQAEQALALWAQQVSVAGMDADQVAQKRRQDREAAALEPKEPVARTVDVDADGVPARLYLPDSEDAGAGAGAGCIVFLHGGGFVFGDVDTHDAQSRRLANRTGFAVLAVDYRRPPEHPFPAAPDDVDTALGWLTRRAADHGVDGRRLVALGDSAGGNLAVVAALRNPGRFAAVVAVYPFIDPRLRYPSYANPAGGLTASDAAWFWAQYTPDQTADPDAAPLDAATLGALPPTLVQAAEHDVLVDEDVELARRIEQAGATVELTTYPGMIHGFWRHPEQFDAAEEALAEIAAFLRRTV